MEKVAVQLGQRSYPIVIAPALLANAKLQPEFSALWHYRQVIIITNPTIAPLYLSSVRDLFAGADVHELQIPDGESFKTLQTFEQATSFLLQQKISRDALLVALGGGVIGDLTGFVAACYQRGIEFLQIPTTLLSQVDSSVGGKTAVNHPLGKNMIGAFKQPQAVLIDPLVLRTLPEREFAAGMAEVIKYALLGDASFFDWLLAESDAITKQSPAVLSEMIRRCCQMKADIVSRDETEQGERALLNLGHTFGHAIEAWLGYGTWLHGEAVAVGMLMAAKLSASRGDLSSEQVDTISTMLTLFKLPVLPPAGMQIADFFPYMKTDKKVKAGKMRFVLFEQLGQAVLVDDVTDVELNQVFANFHV
ncbi:MAG: 3-dehydroquinate synthase [Gammaproteobacteria bacterium]|nr:3-dehydroquinate synthase [Gammaproteobacteria bacterium]